MPRARVFVLREKQMEILPRVQPIFARWLDSEDVEDRLTRTKRVQKDISTLFENIEFSEDEIGSSISESDYHLAALIAHKLLDKDVPDTKPAWFAPWSE